MDKQIHSRRDIPMDTITTQHGLRRRLGRLTAVACGSVALLAFGLGGAAGATTVHTPSGQSFTVSTAPGSFIIRTSGSGFASGGKIRIDVRYPKTGDVARAWATATSAGQFKAAITVPRDELFFGRCHRFEYLKVCQYSGTVYLSATQYSPQYVRTPRVSTSVHASCWGLYSCH